MPLIGAFLMVGIWPIIMGITMWVQMKMNPTPPDPTQAMIFNWMPVFFTILLASFPAGLVIYLGLEQLPVGDAAVRDHATPRREGGAVDNITGLFKRGKAKGSTT